MNSTIFIDRATLIGELKNACNSNTLLTSKHDHNNKLIYDKFRSALTPQASASLSELINSEKYDLDEYYNNNHKKYSYLLVPHDSGSYSAVGFGIPSGSLQSSGSFDSYIVVSGSSDGWHIYSENLSEIQTHNYMRRL